jgi:hypothetical protein
MVEATGMLKSHLLRLSSHLNLAWGRKDLFDNVESLKEDFAFLSFLLHHH